MNVKGLQKHLLVFAGMCILTVCMTWPSVPKLASRKIGHADAEIFRWNLWWVHTALQAPESTVFYTKKLFYPVGVPLDMAPLSYLNCLLAYPLIARLGPSTAFNLLLLGSFVLAGYFMFLLVDDLIGDPAVSFFSGFVFAFLPFHRAHIIQLDYASIQWIPLFILALWRLNDRPSPVRGLLSGLAFAACFLACETYGAMACLFVLLFLTWHAVHNRRIFADRRWLLSGAIAAVTAIAASLPRLAPALRSQGTGFTTMPDPEPWSADVLAYVIPALDHRLIGPYMMKFYQYFPGLYVHWTVFAGFTVFTLALLSWLLKGKRPASLWMWAGAVFFVLSLGPVLQICGRSSFRLFGASFSVPLPYRLLHRFPPFNTSRIPSLFAAYFLCALCVMAAYGLLKVRDRVRARLPGVNPVRAGASVVVLALLLVYIEYMPATYPVNPMKVPESAQAIRSDQRTVSVLSIPSAANEAMFLQTFHEKPIFLGTVCRIPERTQAYIEGLPGFMKWGGGADVDWDELAEQTFREGIQRYQVGYIIVHKDALSREAVRKVTARLHHGFGCRILSDDASFTVFQTSYTSG